MIARQPVGQLWLAGVFPGLMMAAMFVLYIYVRCRLKPHLGPPLPPEERDVPLGEKLRLLRAGIMPFVIFFVDDRRSSSSASPTSPSRAPSAALAATLAALVARPAVLARCSRTSIRQTLGITCMFLWIILAALGFGAVFDGLGAVRALERLFIDELGARALGGPDHDADVSFLVMGMFLDDTAMLVIVAPLYVPLVDRARLRPDLVRRALHDHLPDRLHHAAVRLQPVPDAGAGAAGDHARRHLPLDRALRADHDRGARASSPPSRRSRCGCRSHVEPPMKTNNHRENEP